MSLRRNERYRQILKEVTRRQFRLFGSPIPEEQDDGSSSGSEDPDATVLYRVTRGAAASFHMIDTSIPMEATDDASSSPSDEEWDTANSSVANTTGWVSP